MIYIFAVLILLFAGAIGYRFSSMVLLIPTNKDDHIYKSEEKSGTLLRKNVEQLVKEELTLPSSHNYNMRGWFFPADRDEGKAVILVHGVTSSLIGCLKYMDMFRRRGFHVLTYDHRRHGQSGGPFTTYGYYEKQDLKVWVDWLFNKCGPACKIGILGESMGASTALQYAATDPRIAFYIADCPYSDLKAELTHRLKEDFHLPPFPLLYLAELFVWLRSGIKFRNVSPIRDIAHVETPILFVHGEEDCFTPKEMTVQLYNAKPGFKRIHIMEKADHAESLATDAALYDRVVGSFLSEIGLSDDPVLPADANEQPLRSKKPISESYA
ncbi:alpha/beta hydrolase [Paenibacillus sp. GCM10027626]|uniref:alpha/beta hydrolase n=1 Tax=Paenibacillus sp. GCM10027626 TaxID=3273411 RepID=UPI003634C3A6